MQTIIHAYCTAGTSLREKIAAGRMDGYDLRVVKEQQPGRKPGWLKIEGDLGDRPGALNVEWDGQGRVLRCRVVNKGRGRPHQIVGDFIAYLLVHHRKRIKAVVIATR